MKLRVWITLCALALSGLVHGYLTMEYYPLHFGAEVGQSLCNVSAAFDCTAAAASRFAAVFGVPLSVWGMTFNGIVFLLVLASWLQLVKDPAQASRVAFGLLGVSVATSLVMAVISASQLGSYCLFCLAAYGLSLVAFISYRGAQTTPFFAHLQGDLKGLLTFKSGIAYFLIVFPISALFIHRSMVRNYGAENLDRVIRDTLAEWESAPSVEWQSKPSLTKGASAESAKMVISEFADFRCGHCKHAAPALAAFVKSNPDVRLQFFVFPLDSTCNPKIEHGDGISCRLAKAVVCAETQGQGWAVHDLLFAEQHDFQKAGSVSGVDAELKRKTDGRVPLEWDKLIACMDDPETDSLIRAQAADGDRAKIRGTPTVFVNGKLLERGQLIPVLTAVKMKLMNH